MRPNKLLYVDTMRGWAILMVIICHQALSFKHLYAPVKLLASYGQTGVFLFFVASAFTLCNSSVERDGERHALRNFFIRRLFRIAPLYYVGVALFFALKLFYPRHGAGFVGDFSVVNVIANIALVHGLMPTAFTGLVPGGWSIGTECAFYLVFPALFAVCRRLHGAFGWKILLIPLAMLGGAGALLLARVGMENNIYWFWYDSILNQLPVFLTGIILFLAVHGGAFTPQLRRDVPAFLVMTGLAVCALKANSFALLPLMSAASFVFLFNIFRVTSTSFGLIERIGRASYSMYIFHTVFAVFATRALLERLPSLGDWENPAFAALCAASITASYAIGRVSEKFIEQPFIATGRRLTRSGRGPQSM